ncbi:hypothetical protein I9W82_002897 [Candida metapsilosis]|uniref:Uncharacterized protein n=1 Tax=Candida metapsilosis TaxID=273372 RepID=A0A8H7ZGM8_9ASCO|nr:hypothetical protein I9W82_002897 [Candida metapsilosis]
MIINKLLYVIFPLLVFFISTITTSHALEVTINNVKIDNPAQVVKSKFKKYMPELQDSLEIPVRPNQQSIRESFIHPMSIKGKEKSDRVNRRGIKSLFKKKGQSSSTSVSVSVSAISSTSILPKQTSSDFIETKVDEYEDSISINQVAHPFNDTTSTVHSRPSWIKSYLNFKSKQTMVHSMSVDPNLKHPGHSGGGGAATSHANSKLKSKITEYEDSLSNPKDLKRWVQLIADKPTAVTNKGSGKGDHANDSVFTSSSIRTKSFTTGNKNDQQQLEIDIDEFINYLINEQGFNRNALQFLRMKNLDYGLGEIEQELNKLKDQQTKPKVIKIGGEEEHVNKANKYKVGFHYVLSLSLCMSILFL